MDKRDLAVAKSIKERNDRIAELDECGIEEESMKVYDTFFSSFCYVIFSALSAS